MSSHVMLSLEQYDHVWYNFCEQPSVFLSFSWADFC